MSEWDEATKAAAKHADDIALLGAGVGAAILRLAIYSGPPRPIGAAAIDSVVMCAIGLACGEVVIALTDNLRLGLAAGVLSGIVGWEGIKTLIMSRAGKPHS